MPTVPEICFSVDNVLRLEPVVLFEHVAGLSADHKTADQEDTGQYILSNQTYSSEYYAFA